IAARVDLATQEVVFCHVVRQAPRLQPLLRERPFELLLGSERGLVIGLHGLRGAVDLGSELATALGDLLGELSHVRVPRLEDLAELLVLALESGQDPPELRDERGMEYCWQ